MKAKIKMGEMEYEADARRHGITIEGDEG